MGLSKDRSLADPAKGAEVAARAYLDEVARVLRAIDPEQVRTFVDVINAVRQSGHTVLAMGNGGSASTASHIACDLAKQTQVPGAPPLRALALTDNVGLLTAWSNDAGFEVAMAELVQTYGTAGDALLAISCSGNSSNLVAAAEMAGRRGLSILVLGGFGGGRLRDLADAYVHVPSHDYGVVESAHLAIEHTVAQLLREAATAAVLVAHRTLVDGPAVIIDRDGVINRNLDAGVTAWDEFEFLPGALEALVRLAEHGHRVMVVTNQANVGRGLITPAQLEEIHRRMREVVLEAGGWVEAVYFCPHLPSDGCACRKPEPGLLLQAASDGGFDITKAFFIGDHESDFEAGKRAGARPMMVLSGRNRDGGAAALPSALVTKDLGTAVDAILSSTNGASSTLNRAWMGA